jgi:D-lactate dehydrogenase
LALLAPKPRVERIAPPVEEPAADRAPNWVAAGTPEDLRRDLVQLVGAEAVRSRALDLVRYASDASPYRLFPRAVVMARDTDDVAKLFAYARRARLPLTFRAAGTSLNGQSQTDGILVDVRKHWTGVAIEDGGARVRVRPGTILGRVNRRLARHRRKLGPDPASTDFATVGGVVANNSGGMRCGVERDSYRTVRALELVLPSGNVIDTGAPGAEERFATLEPALARGLTEIRDEIRADAQLSDRIRRKFAIKNTTGYRLCAFLDADTPLEIFRRLVIGSEGTLAFVAEVVFDTVPVPAHTIVSFVHFEDIDAAAAPVRALIEAGATAVELMVAPALIVASHSIPGTPAAWRDLPPESAALLVEFGSDDADALDGLEAAAQRVLAQHDLIRPAEFTREAELSEVYWRVREGMHGLVGKLRPEGTALIMEDICVPPERIAEAAKDLRALLAKHGFLPGVAGHASAGNLHFMLTPKFSEAAERDRYDAFMSELVDLIVDEYDGSLKAEHGTGLNMAPFVKREWGEKATALMWRIKELADPDGVLAPGVVLNRDPGVHLRNLKTTPPIEEVATTCVECGFCEPVCPSRELTTTPRQRIVLRREMARQPQGSPVQRALLEQYEYDGIETCAVDGSCSLACPLGIDTGKLIKGFRAAEHGERSERAALRAAKRWGAVSAGARAGLRAGHLLGPRVTRALTSALRRVAGEEHVPDWLPQMPRAASARLPATTREGAAAVYYPACINRIFGTPSTNGSGPAVTDALVAVSARAGMPVWIPDDIAGTCCANVWTSKGYGAASAFAANKFVESAWRWSDGGRLPIVIDASSCSLGVAREIEAHLTPENQERQASLELVDSIAWCHRLAPKLTVKRKVGSVAVHPTCSAQQLGLSRPLVAAAELLAEEVVVPTVATCCGFAGDRGFLHPELTEAATLAEAAEVMARPVDAYVSSNRTCELGLERATGAPYKSILQLLEELTRDPD